MKNPKVLQSLGIALGLLIAGFLNVLPWTTLAMIMAASVVLIVVIPPKYSDRNPYAVSISAWIAAGMVVIGGLALLVGSIPYLAWVVLAWLLVSVILGMLRPWLVRC